MKTVILNLGVPFRNPPISATLKSSATLQTNQLPPIWQINDSFDTAITNHYVPQQCLLFTVVKENIGTLTT